MLSQLKCCSSWHRWFEGKMRKEGLYVFCSRDWALQELCTILLRLLVHLKLLEFSPIRPRKNVSYLGKRIHVPDESNGGSRETFKESRITGRKDRVQTSALGVSGDLLLQTMNVFTGLMPWSLTSSCCSVNPVQEQEMGPEMQRMFSRRQERFGPAGGQGKHLTSVFCMYDSGCWLSIYWKGSAGNEVSTTITVSTQESPGTYLCVASFRWLGHEGWLVTPNGEQAPPVLWAAR